MKGLRIYLAPLRTMSHLLMVELVAYIQEFRFTKYIKRLQSMIQPTIDREFKMFLKHRGIEIDSGSFEIQFNEPQNFGKYRQVEIDNQMVSIFTQVQQIPYISKRFACHVSWSR